MKNILLLLSTFILAQPVFAGNLPFEIRGKYSRSIRQGQLVKARSVGDLVTGYAFNWISGDITVEILVSEKGQTVKASGKQEELTLEQKRILGSVELASHIVINVHYKNENAVTGRTDDRTMHVVLTVVPETEAAFSGGTDKMKQFIRENVIQKINELTSEYILDGSVSFTVNESGVITNARLSKSTGDPNTDRLMLSAIQKMPKWKPAVNLKGQFVSQDFEFIMGNQGC